MVTTQMKDAVCKESRYDLRANVGSPEVRKADGQFSAFVKIAEVENDLI